MARNKDPSVHNRTVLFRMW